MVRVFQTHFVLATAMSLSCAFGAYGAESPVETGHDLPNFHQVEDNFYRGGQPSEKGMQDLQKMGVKTIFDLRNPGEMKFSEKEEASKLGMEYLNLPMNSAAPSKETVDKVMHAVEEAQQDKGAKGSVFVHCAHGSDRTGCMVGIWRVTHDKWDYDKTYAEMRKYYFTPKFTHLSGAVKEYSEHAAEH